MKKISAALILWFAAYAVGAQQKTENIILVTLDGMRWQEVYGGAEKRLIMDRTFVSDSARLVGKFWNEDENKRRELLFPFLWTTVAKNGVLYGNRNLGNKVNVTNNQWFSYPGYNELLCGFADNERIHSNDKIENPNHTVLEFINKQKPFTGKVAAFTSWDVFPFIINSKRSGIPVNGGIEEAKGSLSPDEKLLNQLMFEVPNPLGDVRLDAFTFRYGWEYLKKNKPRVLYFAFDETDDFAHGGKYDLYLESAHYEDGFLQKLWSWVQSTQGYKDKTTLIVTCDHGRGNVEKDSWRHHGAKVEGADQIWMAFIGPDTPAIGEAKDNGQLYQNQVARTMAALLGLDYSGEKPAGAAITGVMGKKQ